ncbi:MAG: flagellar biosynthetic protein FliO [Tardiphaga sp.]|uniref:flagellar biosynthetic protein FliO n=1 Tax=Tardiphaga sp. TaxID=1926292 RepID=UPI001990D68C|nr:flagellar biosynthetic protein FliO [Tardiphaga sp.]MBC7583361.1 flagellar biosynthetic protein FliO [Tardiphaga sp.]
MQTSPYTFFFAFIAVLALIGLAAWLVRRFAGNRLGSNAARGRMPRLAVIDAAAVDGRRRLVLVRRDNVEHLLMIGGPTDIVVEPNIIRAMPGREQAPPRSNVGSELSMRSAPLDAPSWGDNETGADPEQPIAEPTPRPNRPSFIDEPRRPLPERRPEPVASFTPPELPSRPEPRPEPRVEPRSEREARPEPAPAPAPARPDNILPRRESLMPRSEPMMPRPMRAEPPIRVAPPLRADRAAAPVPAPAPTPAPVPAPAAAPTPEPAVASTPAASADQNLAEMAQRLEAALRRPVADSRSEPLEPRTLEPRTGEPRTAAPPVAPEQPAARPAPRFSSELSIAALSRSDAPAAPAAPAVAPPVKTGFENLEDEMASLLGRPKSSS